MKKVLCLLWILLAGACQAQDENPDDGITPPTSPSRITEPRDLVIEAVGVTSLAARRPHPECPDFKLSMDEVREFFREAREVDNGVYMHMLDWSPCLVEGTLTLPNGDKAKWGIQQSRAGSVLQKSGESIFLYCARCTAKAFPPAE